MSGKDVWQHYLDGDVGSIRDYCETDVLNTYLVYLSFERMRGHLLESQFHAELQRLRSYLASANQAHFSQFLGAWPVATRLDESGAATETAS